MEEIKKGDVVEIKSGGPKMTVIEIYNGEATCIWYYEGKASERNLPIEALKKIDVAQQSDNWFDGM